ncbi:MAG: hypothetical protein AAF638_01330 [Pseudomonadota bacterium]
MTARLEGNQINKIAIDAMIDDGLVDSDMIVKLIMIAQDEAGGEVLDALVGCNVSRLGEVSPDVLALLRSIRPDI